MSVDSGSDPARAGQRLKHKVLVALALSVGGPLLVLLLILPALHSGLVQVVVVVTIVGMLAGAWIIWDLGRLGARMGALMASDTVIHHRQDEVNSLMASFNKMLVIIEEQSAEINTFASRLDAAHKDLELTNTRLKDTAFKDDVTGLYNRRYLLLRLEEEIQLGRPLALVLLELERLRTVAEREGHVAYDEALLDFAQILLRAGSTADDVMARYDGSRFAALLVATRRPDAVRFVDGVTSAVMVEYLREEVPRLRVGMACRPGDGDVADQLISAADADLRRDSPAD